MGIGMDAYEQMGRELFEKSQGAPILLIGMGGVGGRIVAQIDKMLAKDSPRRDKVAILAIDTNVKDLRKLREQGIETIQISDERLVRQYLKDHPQYMSWFPNNIFLNNRGMLEGAGQIRAISRLAALAAEEEGKFRPIEEAVRKIAAVTGSGLKENIMTILVGSICGGTGAGMFIQIPFYVKKIIQKVLAIPNVMVRGMFLGPDIMAPIQPGDLNRQAVYVNAYACLKELNAFYLLQRRDASSSLLRMEYYDYGENEDLEAEVMESRQMYQAIAKDLSSKGVAVLDEEIPEEGIKVGNGCFYADRLAAGYGKRPVAEGLSFHAGRGEIVTLIGPNGAGKTSLIRIINQITGPDSGELYFKDHKLEPADMNRIGYLPEERGLYKKMKVGEQAVYLARLKGVSRHDAIQQLKAWFEKFGIEAWWDRKVEELSKGMAQKVQFITTVLHEPEMLIFDEPFSGFDPINANMLKEEILALRDKGATVIFSTHNMSSVEEICDHITLINKSHNILSGSVDEVRRRFGENIFEVTYDGDPAQLESVAAPMAELLGTTEVSDTPYHTTRLKLNPTTSVRNIVAAVNDAVNLRSFNEVIPSMNDIFIRAVEGKL